MVFLGEIIMLDKFLGAADAVLAVETGFNDLRPKGLCYSQYRVLRCLDSKETLKTVAKKRNITQQATGKAMKRLVTLGLAVQIKHPKGKKNVDRRESSISVTDKGKDALKVADQTIKAIIKRVK